MTGQEPSPHGKRSRLTLLIWVTLIIGSLLIGQFRADPAKLPPSASAPAAAQFVNRAFYPMAQKFS